MLSEKPGRLDIQNTRDRSQGISEDLQEYARAEDSLGQEDRVQFGVGQLESGWFGELQGKAESGEIGRNPSEVAGVRSPEGKKKKVGAVLEDQEKDGGDQGARS
jgi:hypothetical protein